MPLAHPRLSWLSWLFGLVWVLTCFVYNATKPEQPELSELFNFSTGHNVLSLGREPTLTNQKVEPPFPPHPHSYNPDPRAVRAVMAVRGMGCI